MDRLKTELIFGVCDTINNYILEKFNKNDNLSFLDHMVFQASSYVISLINKNMLIGEEVNINNCFIHRCLIEDIAIIRMYLEGDIPRESIELLNKYYVIPEYEIYKKYRDDLDGTQYDLNKIGRDYKAIKAKYREVMNNKSSVSFKKILSSKLPWLLNEYSYSELVENYYPNAFPYYRLLSVLVHPNDISVVNEFYKKFDIKLLEERIISDVMSIVVDNYSNDVEEVRQTIDNEFAIVFNQELNRKYWKLANENRDILNKLSKLINEMMGFNTQSDTLDELAQDVILLVCDEMFGYSEVIKSRFKHVAELLAVSKYIWDLRGDNKGYDKLQVVNSYTKINLLKATDYPAEIIDKYYDEGLYNYKKAFGDISVDEFKDKMETTLGFMENKTSINKLVYSLLDKISNDKVVVSHMKMLYDEAQILSHANGYMIGANTGAFMECKTVISFIDRMIYFWMLEYQGYWIRYQMVNPSERVNSFIRELKILVEALGKVSLEKNNIDHTNTHMIYRSLK